MLVLLVVSRDTVDSGFDKNQSKLGVLILAVSFQVFSDRHGLLDEVVEIFRDFWGKSVCLEDSQNFGSSHSRHLGNTMGITKEDTNLGWGQTFLGKTPDVVTDILRGGFEPTWSRFLVRDCRFGNTLSATVHTNHLECFRAIPM